MDKIDIMAETVDGNSTKGCEAYDYESGKCKDTNKPCDTCYANTVGTSGGCGDGCKCNKYQGCENYEDET